MAWRARALSLTVWRTPCAVEEIDRSIDSIANRKEIPTYSSGHVPNAPPRTGYKKAVNAESRTTRPAPRHPHGTKLSLRPPARAADDTRRPPHHRPR